MLPKNRRPTPPGEIIKYEYMEPLGLTQQQLADALKISRVRVNEIISGKRGVTPDTAIRLSLLLNTTVEFWLGMQMSIDLWDTYHSDKEDYRMIQPLPHGETAKEWR